MQKRMQKRASVFLLFLVVSLLIGGCATQPGSGTSPTATQTSGSGSGGGQPTFPTTKPQLVQPTFGQSGKIAPTVKVVASVAPTLIVQFPIVPSGIKAKFPNAKGVVTIFQNPTANDFDILNVSVQGMPPNVKFTVFLIELAKKPFGNAEYVGDVITRGDGTGDSTFHLITFVAFAADNRHADVSSPDQTGDASGVQLEHLGMWFDGIENAQQVLGDPTLKGTPFDGGRGPLHAGPQAMTDGQDLPVF